MQTLPMKHLPPDNKCPPTPPPPPHPGPLVLQHLPLADPAPVLKDLGPQEPPSHPAMSHEVETHQPQPLLPNTPMPLWSTQVCHPRCTLERLAQPFSLLAMSLLLPPTIPLPHHNLPRPQYTTTRNL